MQHKGGIQSLRVRSRDTVVWDLTHFSHESNELWEEAQVLVTGQQVTIVIDWTPQLSRDWWQVVIEATKGDSEAVDTVMLQDQFSQCATRPAEADPGANTTPAPAVLTNCDFEAGLCGSVVSIV